MSWSVDKIEHIGNGRFNVGLVCYPEVGVIITSRVVLETGWGSDLPHIGEHYHIHLEKAGDDEHPHAGSDG
jgi:hypothetical protein